MRGLSPHRFRSLVCLVSSLSLSSLSFATVQLAQQEALGLYQPQDFDVLNQGCHDCAVPEQAQWYFQHEWLALAKQQAAGFNPQLTAQQDVQQAKGQLELPPFVWLGSQQVLDSVYLEQQGQVVVDARANATPLKFVDQLASNRSFFNEQSVAYLAGRGLRLRGQMTESGQFVARSLWPQDYNLQLKQLPYQPLAAGQSLIDLVRADGKQPTAPLTSRVLWQSATGSARDWAGKPVLAMMLNGAQGDDDEAHGGHFAVATGVFGPEGQWHNWLVNNFYNLDSVSEKGIIAATLPMDSYLGDLNSGQSWYRPSYMLVVVLKQPRIAQAYQSAISRVFNHFYRHDFRYQHALANCAGISLESLRSLGWHIPKQGATNWPKALVALPYMAIKDWSIESGRKAFDYLVAEQTNLYPLVAFNALAQDLLTRLVTGSAQSEFERQLHDDVEAVIYVSIPQLPSSRRLGQAPVASIDEYQSRVPANDADWQIVPVGPRPFPSQFQALAQPEAQWRPSTWALLGYGLALMSMLFWVGHSLIKRSKRGKSL